MAIEVPNLDDRRFQDIVDELKLKIPEYYPAWTNHNVSDPGVALIELFAFMTEMTLFKLNQLPERAMKTLLNTVGFEVFPARAATADLTFFITRPPSNLPGIAPVRIPSGTPVGTDGSDGSAVVFETDEELVLHQPVLVRCGPMSATGVIGDRIDGNDDIVSSDKTFDPPLVCFDGLAAARQEWNSLYTELPPEQQRGWRPPRRGFLGDAVYFGFARPLSGAVVRLTIEATTHGFGGDPDRPPTVWEASTPEGFARCKVTDTTAGLNRAGTVDVAIPADHSTAEIDDDDELYWLRLRLDPSVCPSYEASPEIDRVSFETIAGVVSAHHAEHHATLVLGLSDGTAGQRFSIGRPVIGGERPVRLFVEDQEWTLVDDFRNATEADKFFTLDASTGEIALGPNLFVRRADRPQSPGAVIVPDTVQRGHVPPAAAKIEARDFRTGGGVAGNRPAGSIRNLRNAVKNVSTVTNYEPAVGGADPEPLDRAIERAPIAIRAGDRAVTIGDYERTVRDAAPDIASVTCRAPGTPGGPIRLLVVPTTSVHPRVQRLDDYELPNDLCKRIKAHLEPRRHLGTQLLLTTPFYLGLSVAVRVLGARGVESDVVRDRVIEKLYRFINPIDGGEAGKGLGFDEVMSSDRIIAALSDIDGVRRVSEVEMFEADARREARLDGGRHRIELPPDTLFMSFRHRVIVDPEDRT